MSLWVEVIHRKAYVKSGKLSNPINNPKPKGAGASDARNNNPEIPGINRATITEYVAAFFSWRFEKVIIISECRDKNLPNLRERNTLHEN